MSQYPQYILNATNNENNQYNMVGFDVNVLKNIMENSGNTLAQNLTQNNSYFPQNKVSNPYLFNVGQNYAPVQQQIMPMMPFPTGNIVYLNQQSHFQPNVTMPQYNSPIVPVQLPPGIVQFNPSDLSKTSDQAVTSTKTRKNSIKPPVKQEIDPNDDIPRDTKNRPLTFCCPACSKRFSTQTRLDQHFLCHTGERPYICNICNFAFTQKSYLMRHTAVHKDERSFECSLCKKTYKHYGSLANHRKTHNNGSRSSSKTTNNNIDHNVTNIQIANAKLQEEISDLSTNVSANTYLPNNNPGEYLFQNPLEIKTEMAQEAVQQQLFDNHQFTTDMGNNDLYANSFQYLLSSSADLSTDINSSFLEQLNLPNVNFYNPPSNGMVNLDSHPNSHTDLTLNPNNSGNSLITLEPATQSNNVDNEIQTYVV